VEKASSSMKRRRYHYGFTGRGKGKREETAPSQSSQGAPTNPLAIPEKSPRKEKDGPHKKKGGRNAVTDKTGFQTWGSFPPW